MKIISFNCNGIRATMKKGFVEYIQSQDPDAFCLQETKANPSQTSPEVWESLGYEGFHHTAEKPGYSSVAIYSKKKPKSIVTGIGLPFFDSEGRSVALEFPKYYLWNVYFPSGTTGDVRQKKKMEFLEHIRPLADRIRSEKKKVILCGDVNIAHTPLDIHNPKGNEKNSGFLPEEREWLSEFLESGWVDCYRFMNPETRKYSWWTYRFQARSQDKGWRIDYFFVNKEWKKKIRKAEIHSQFHGSDHAPLYLEIDT